MTMVKINGEELEVTVDAPGATLADTAAEALRLHRRVCAGTRAAERAEEKRRGTPVTKIGSSHFGFKPEAEAEDETEDEQ